MFARYALALSVFLAVAPANAETLGQQVCGNPEVIASLLEKISSTDTDNYYINGSADGSETYTGDIRCIASFATRINWTNDLPPFTTEAYYIAKRYGNRIVYNLIRTEQRRELIPSPADLRPVSPFSR